MNVHGSRHRYVRRRAESECIALETPLVSEPRQAGLESFHGHRRHHEPLRPPRMERLGLFHQGVDVTPWAARPNHLVEQVTLATIGDREHVVAIQTFDVRGKPEQVLLCGCEDLVDSAGYGHRAFGVPGDPRSPAEPVHGAAELHQLSTSSLDAESRLSLLS